MTDSTSERTIGRLEGKVDTLLEQGEQSRQSRAKLYERVDEVANKVSGLDHRVGQVEAAVKIMEPLVEDYGRLKQRGLGILAVIGFVWLILGGVILEGLKLAVGSLMKAMGGGP